MKISIDLDGTMWSHMAFFREFMKAMLSAGHSVGVLTGHTADMQDADVNLMLARGFPAPSFYLGRTAEYVPFNGAKFKSDMIRKHKIDIHFDDLDYCNDQTIAIFLEDSSVLERIFVVRWKEPRKVHYE